MIDRALKGARVFLHSLLESQRGDRLPPLRWTRRAASFVNDLAGRPLCSAQELSRREQELREAEERRARAQENTGNGAAAKREPAPVVLYVTDQDPRTRKKMEEILKGRDIPYQVNDLTDDEATRSWAQTRARKGEFPLLFIAGEPAGDLHDLTQLDVSGELLRRVYG